MGGPPARLFQQTAYYAAATGRDAYNKPTFGTKTAIKVRAEAVRKRMTDQRGEDFVSEHRVYGALNASTGAYVALDLNYWIWPPGVDQTVNENARKVRIVEAFADGGGTERYREVIL